MLSRKTYFVKERVGFVKLTDAYDIFDPETQQQIGLAKEEPAAWAKRLRNSRCAPVCNCAHSAAP